MITAEMVNGRMRIPQQVKVRRVWRRHPGTALFSIGRKKVVALLSLLLLVLSANVILQAYVAKARYDLTKCNAAIAELERKISIEAIEIADLSSERNIEQAAEERFGMRRARPHEVAYLPTIDEIPVPAYKGDSDESKLLLASIHSEGRLGLSERFVAWL